MAASMPQSRAAHKPEPNVDAAPGRRKSEAMTNDRDLHASRPIDPDAAISARGVRKVYAGTKKSAPKEALKGIDLDVPRGSVFGLLGPNGAGKSTFINILAGLVVKTSGNASIWGFDIDENPRQSRASIGVVPQEISQDVFFTPKEGLEIQAGLYGVPKNRRRTMEILTALGLADKADAYVRTLSGGMKRRLLVAKAMVHDPPVLILDEPTAGVDIELRRQLWDQVMQLHARGVTVILTTHYLEEAQELCDTIGIIHKGEVVTVRPKDELIASLDRKALMVVPEDPIAPALIAGIEGASLKPDGSLLIDYKPSRTRVSDLLAGVNAAGIKVRDISTVEADLEDVFLEMTYGSDGG
ncbi:MAG: ABC transporter ATP-binding protein [Parvularcula sp.]|nr:ABC transporter ATP-binding protein [Parvularcula sp.]